MTILLAIMVMPAQGQTRDFSADALIRQRDGLGLSEEQVERIKEAQEADREARDAMRLEMRELRDQLRDEEITREEFREESEARRSTARDDRIAYRDALDGILTDEQRSQVRGLRRELARRQRIRGDRGGPGPRPRPRANRR